MTVYGIVLLGTVFLAQGASWRDAGDLLASSERELANALELNDGARLAALMGTELGEPPELVNWRSRVIAVSEVQTRCFVAPERRSATVITSPCLLAVVKSTWTESVPAGGKPARAQRYLDMWVRRDEVWVLTGRHELAATTEGLR